MNKLLSSYLSNAQPAPSQPILPVSKQVTTLEQVAELPEEEEELPNSPFGLRGLYEGSSSSRPGAAARHNKGVSDSSSTPNKCARKSTAQQLFKQELQRRCESLVLTSQKLISDDDARNQGEEMSPDQDQDSSSSYTEMIDSRNMAVGQSALARSGSTRDSTQGQDEVYDVLATIKASQERQETETFAVNYIIDTTYDDECAEISAVPESIRKKSIGGVELDVSPPEETRPVSTDAPRTVKLSDV